MRPPPTAMDLSAGVCAVNGQQQLLLQGKGAALTAAFPGNRKKVKQLTTSVAVLKIRVATKTNGKTWREKPGVALTAQSLL